MLNALKVLAISAADIVNRIHNPFDEFTRPIITRTSERLWDKAQRFEIQMRSEFELQSGVYAYVHPSQGHDFDWGDQALWHGIYTAMWAFKYAVTKNADDASVLRASALAQMHHIENGKLVRARIPGTDAITDNASNDTLTGFLAGGYFAWKHGTPDVREIARTHLTRIGYEVLTNGHALVKQDGTPTTYGVLIDGWKTDPLRLTLALALYALLDKMTDEVRWNHALNDLVDRYWELVAYPKVKFLWWEKKYDTHRAALHLLILKECVTNKELVRLCEAGLARIWAMEHKALDPWLASLCGIDALGPTDMKLAAQRLREYEVEERGIQVERCNTLEKDYWAARGVRFLIWDGQWRASQPLPFWKMGSQDFFPQRDLFSADNWKGQTDRRLRYNGGDFLAAYWRMRLLGVVSSDD